MPCNLLFGSLYGNVSWFVHLLKTWYVWTRFYFKTDLFIFSGIDDLFLINAALYLCRKDNNVKIVSNDKFMDHCMNMKPETICYFERWLSDHQVTVHWYNRTKMNLRGPKVRARTVRTLQTLSYHV